MQGDRRREEQPRLRQLGQLLAGHGGSSTASSTNNLSGPTPDGRAGIESPQCGHRHLRQLRRRRLPSRRDRHGGPGARAPTCPPTPTSLSPSTSTGGPSGPWDIGADEVDGRDAGPLPLAQRRRLGGGGHLGRRGGHGARRRPGGVVAAAALRGREPGRPRLGAVGFELQVAQAATCATGTYATSGLPAAGGPGR